MIDGNLTSRRIVEGSLIDPLHMAPLSFCPLSLSLSLSAWTLSHSLFVRMNYGAQQLAVLLYEIL